MSQNELNDLIHNAEQDVAHKEASRNVFKPEKKVLWPVYLLFIGLLLSLAYNVNRLTHLQPSLNLQEQEAGYRDALMIISDGVLTEYHQTGHLPNQLTGLLASEIPVEYTKLNKLEYELSIETQEYRLILLHNNFKDFISLVPIPIN